ncbi:MAG: hypothetical protein QOH89_2040 [Pseudonocardiales bacterium]|nr:hypothetical protein [Pseudonocardiales bacterium]
MPRVSPRVATYGASGHLYLTTREITDHSSEVTA